MNPKTGKIKYRVSPSIIWLSSLFMGILASVLKIAERHFNISETLVNSAVTFLFSLFVWYYNIHSLQDFSSSSRKNRQLSKFKLMRSLMLGLAVMFLLAYVQQLLLTSLEFGPTMLMVEVRGILINLILYMFLHLLYQGL